MEVKNAMKAYNRQLGQPQYQRVYHTAGHSKYSHGFYVNMPIFFLPVDSLNGATKGVVALSKNMKNPPLRCRCGFVEQVFYFHLDKLGFMVCGMKIMDRIQIVEQEDDILNETNVMECLQPTGLLKKLRDSHFLRWQYAEDLHNKYIVTEYASNGSLIQYATSEISELAEVSAQRLIEKNTPESQMQKSMCVLVGQEWSRKGLDIFYHLLQGLTYMHTIAKVAHLDLDPCNVVIDGKNRVRIIDFGSSQQMDAERHWVCDGFKNLVKFKPCFVANEVRINNHLKPPRVGFNGELADMYSAGVILYQLLCWGYPGGDGAVVKNPHWKKHFFQHYEGKHQRKQKNCYLCYYNVSIPGYVMAILYRLLQEEPSKRWTAMQTMTFIEEHVARTENPVTEVTNTLSHVAVSACIMSGENNEGDTHDYRQQQNTQSTEGSDYRDREVSPKKGGDSVRVRPHRQTPPRVVVYRPVPIPRPQTMIKSTSIKQEKDDMPGGRMGIKMEGNNLSDRIKVDEAVTTIQRETHTGRCYKKKE